MLYTRTTAINLPFLSGIVDVIVLLWRPRKDASADGFKDPDGLVKQAKSQLLGTQYSWNTQWVIGDIRFHNVSYSFFLHASMQHSCRKKARLQETRGEDRQATRQSKGKGKGKEVREENKVSSWFHQITQCWKVCDIYPLFERFFFGKSVCSFVVYHRFKTSLWVSHCARHELHFVGLDLDGPQVLSVTQGPT